MLEVEWDDEIPGFDGIADGSEYTVADDLVLTPKVLNTGGYSAEATITVAYRDVFEAWLKNCCTRELVALAETCKEVNLVGKRHPVNLL